jgi:hypothetical protein
LVRHDCLNKIWQWLGSAPGVFCLGVVIGFIFFAVTFGLGVVNPTATDWIFNDATHDTAQHYLGWAFFREGSHGAIITGLAAPEGLALTFMDAIPLLALPLKLLAGILPTHFQYFGAWALLCYLLLGGLAAILARKIWRAILAKKTETVRASATKQSKQKIISYANLWQIIFVTAVTILVVINPITLARTLYHPALAAQWLILLGFLLIWNARKLAGFWQFVGIWSVVLVATILIHPYFVPMMGALCVIAALRNVAKFNASAIARLVAQILLPVALTGLTFYLIGGFSLGSGAEIRDLADKGFNLASFAISNGYSVIPSLPQYSYSPETMMWLGLGVWLLAAVAAILTWGQYRRIWRKFVQWFRRNLPRNILLFMVGFGLLVFAIGVRVDWFGIVLFQWQPPDKIYELWSAFRAAAREAWPFYFVTIFGVIAWFAWSVKQKISSRTSARAPLIIALVVLAAAVLQTADLSLSPKYQARREGFANITTEYMIRAPQIADLVTTQTHMIELDSSFRGDADGFYELGQAALQNHLTLNIGFFARVPESAMRAQSAWRAKVADGKLSAADLRDNLFVTKDAKFARALEQLNQYRITQRGQFYFISKSS